MTSTVDPSTAAWILFGVFFTLMALRVPVAFALGLACLPIYILEDRLDPQGLIQETFNAYNSFILLAVPFFLLTANLMNIGGITDRLVRFSRALSTLPSCSEKRSNHERKSATCTACSCATERLATRCRSAALAATGSALWRPAKPS